MTDNGEMPAAVVREIRTQEEEKQKALAQEEAQRQQVRRRKELKWRGGIIACLFMMIGWGSYLIHNFVQAYAEAGDGLRTSMSEGLIAVREELRLVASDRTVSGERAGELADDIERLRAAIDSPASLTTVRVGIQLDKLGHDLEAAIIEAKAANSEDALNDSEDESSGTSAGSNEEAETDGRGISTRSSEYGTGRASTTMGGGAPAGIRNSSDGPLARLVGLVRLPGTSSRVSASSSGSELLALENAAKQIENLYFINDDLIDESIDSYSSPWFRRALRDEAAKVAVFVVCAGCLMMCALVPLLLAWREVSAVDTIARLRARGLKMEVLGAVVFVVAVGALLVGVIAFVQVGDLVASDVKVAKGLEVTKQRLEKKLAGEAEQPFPDLLELEKKIKGYDRLIDKAEGRLNEIRKRREAYDGGHESKELLDSVRQGLGSDVAANTLVDEWVELSRGMTEAELKLQEANHVLFIAEREDSRRKSKKEVEEAKAGILKAKERLSSFLEANPPLKRALDAVDATQRELENEHWQLEEQRDLMRMLRRELEQEKIRADLAQVLGSSSSPASLNISGATESKSLPVGATQLPPGATGEAPRDVPGGGTAPPASVDAPEGSSPESKPKDPEGNAAEPEAEDPKSDSFSSFNWQVNLTRAGISIFTLFLVQMLLGLQRYITRLASFYYGRADALELISAKDGMRLFGEMGFASIQERREILESMSPMSVDYAKTVAPNKEIVEFAKSIVTESGRRGR